MGPVTPIPEGKPDAGISIPRAVVPQFEVRDWGFDTLAFALRPTSARSVAALRSPIAFTDRLSDYETKPSVTDVAGHPTHVTVNANGTWSMRLGFAWVTGFPDSGFLRIEGRGAALMARDPSATGLTKPSELRRVEGAALRIAWAVLGGEAFIPEDLMVRRWDLAVDLESQGAAADGSASLEALSALRLPYWGRPSVHHARGRTDLVTGASWPASGRRQFRAYDKGVELSLPSNRERDASGDLRRNSQARAPGHLIRLERQVRPTNPGQWLSPTNLASSDLEGSFLGRWKAVVKAPGILVCSPEAAQVHLSKRFDEGLIGLQECRRLIGAVAASSLDLNPQLSGDSQSLAALLRAHGVALARSFQGFRSVDLCPMLRLASEPWRVGKPVGVD